MGTEIQETIRSKAFHWVEGEKESYRILVGKHVENFSW
jgi:hypothetical protein